MSRHLSISKTEVSLFSLEGYGHQESSAHILPFKISFKRGKGVEGEREKKKKAKETKPPPPVKGRKRFKENGRKERKLSFYSLESPSRSHFPPRLYLRFPIAPSRGGGFCRADTSTAQARRSPSESQRWGNPDSQGRGVGKKK